MEKERSERSMKIILQPLFFEKSPDSKTWQVFQNCLEWLSKPLDAQNYQLQTFKEKKSKIQSSSAGRQKTLCK